MSLSFKIKLLRADVALGSIPTVEDCLLSPPQVKRGTPIDIVNDVRVNYALRVAIPIPSIIAVAAALWGNYVLISDGTLWAFGDDYFLGCCDDYTCGGSNDPVRVNLAGTEQRNDDYFSYPDWSLDLVPKQIVFVDGGNGSDNAGFIDTDGQLWGLADNYSYCQEGVGDQYGGGDDCLIAMGGAYAGEHDFVFVSVGNHHTMAIDSAGLLWCWGRTTYGAVGDGRWFYGDTTWRCEPFNPVLSGKSGGPSIAGKTWVWCSAGWYNSCAIDSEGQLWTWGANYEWDLGHGPSATGPEDYWRYPTQVGTDTDWVKCFGAEYEMAAMKEDGSVWFSGMNWYGGHGNGLINGGIPSFIPTGYFAQGGGDHNYVDFKFAYYWGMGIRIIDGERKTFVWGTNVGGNLGQGDSNDYYSPIAFPVDFIMFDIESWHGIGMDVDRNIWVWGDEIGAYWPETDPPVDIQHDWTGEGS
jgi:alpha-tubulin suppressor-like RCC1 family protein